MPNPNPQNTREQWEQLYHQLSQSGGSNSLRADFPGVAPKITPLVNKPVCDDTHGHCRGHFIDRELVCTNCGARPYVVVCHEWPWSEGHYWHAVEPQHGAPPYEPARECPNCQEPI